MHSMGKEDLIRLIEACFPEKGLNGGISQKQAHEIDDRRIPLAPGVVRNDETIMDDWRKLTSVDDSIFFELDLNGWHYYLPACLRTDLLSGFGLGDSLMFFLLPTEANDDERFDHSSWSPSNFIETWEFNKVQANCIANVLNFFRTEFNSAEKMQLKKWLEMYGENA